MVSDVTKLIKICIGRMRILTFKIRWMRMRIEEFLFKRVHLIVKCSCSPRTLVLGH